MDTDLDTLATALYVRVDDLLRDRPELVPPRPRVGLLPKRSDAEAAPLAAMLALTACGGDGEDNSSATTTKRRTLTVEVSTF